LKDDPNEPGTEITLIARIALHLSYSRDVQLKTTESGFQRILYLCWFLKTL